MIGRWSDEPVGQRQDLMKKIMVEHSSYQEAINGIRRFHRPVDGGVPDAGSLGLLIGDSRTGKTFAAKRYVKEFANTAGPEGMVMPVVRVDMPADGGPAAILAAIAGELGLLVTQRMTNQMVFAAIKRALGRAKTELLILDEAEQFARPDAKRLLAYVRDLLRKLLDIGTFNILCVGLEKTYDVLQSDPRLVGRGLLPYTRLAPYEWGSREGRNAFRLLCQGFDQYLPFDEMAELASTDIALRLYTASQGNVGRLHDMIYFGGCVALNRQANRLELSHLAEAYDIRRPYNDPFNPFRDNIENKPRRSNEPATKARAAKIDVSIFDKATMAVGLSNG